ncbi:hypothetical protein M501DRAFT_1023203 [Patellaria atrata CBS 101060]|uniref:Mediator of RNA polymerase II transcription subunit 18 n=1 Tax=Patellaria atrata CBS 101060 TaxID=1346257 RepID=A0A9P4SE01_9PEZI|nr:hypothetical protein M501DRAFT_1023203 [Patellaria atrata CBS 101060]
MHEILLFGQVPDLRHESVLKILAGLAAMQPQRVIERHAIYRPYRGQVQRASIHTGGSQVVQNAKVNRQEPQVKDLYYTKLVQSLTDDDLNSEKLTVQSNGKSTAGSWSFQFHDVPEPSMKQASQRMVAITAINEGDPNAWMNALGYNYLSEHILEGHRVVHENVIVLLHRLLRFPPEMRSRQAPREQLLPLNDLNPFKAQTGYVIQASIRISEPKPEIIKKALAELTKFKDQVKGIVDLTVVDRLSLDTRIK